MTVLNTQQYRNHEIRFVTSENPPLVSPRNDNNLGTILLGSIGWNVQNSYGDAAAVRVPRGFAGTVQQLNFIRADYGYGPAYQNRWLRRNNINIVQDAYIPVRLDVPEGFVEGNMDVLSTNRTALGIHEHDSMAGAHGVIAVRRSRICAFYGLNLAPGETPIQVETVLEVVTTPDYERFSIAEFFMDDVIPKNVKIKKEKKEPTRKNVTKAIKADVMTRLRVELQDYNDYLRGDVYEASVISENGVEHPIGTYYGYDRTNVTAMTAAVEWIDGCLPQEDAREVDRVVAPEIPRIVITNPAIENDTIDYAEAPF